MGREKPILFCTGMVQAVLEGRKTATRRICKGVGGYSVPDMQFYDAGKRTYAVHNYADEGHREKLSIAERTCPICPDDILYVRETWSFVSCIKCSGDYRPKGEPLNCYDTKAVEYDDGSRISDGCFLYRAGYTGTERVIWRPSIHMPKAAARIWLRVTDVRVERLQDMTLDDFLAEGAALRPEAFNDPDNEYWLAREIFKGIWDGTVPKADLPEYGWDANPWVWVIEFERCEKMKEESCI